MECGGFDVMLLTEMNIHTEAYTHNRLGYELMCSKAHPFSAGGYQCGVGPVTRERLDGWGIESIRLHRPNMVSSKIVTGPTQNPLVGAYLPP